MSDFELSSKPRLRSWEWTVVGIIVIALLLCIFARLMNFEMRKDEQLYVPPAELLSHARLYTDFFYNHVPGTAWLFHGIMLGTGTDHLLLAARFGVFAGWVLFAIAAVVITYSLSRSVAMTMLAVVLVLSNDLLLGQTGMTATNNLLPLPFAFLGFGLFLRAITSVKPSFALAALAGLMLGLAASMKISFAGFIPPIGLAALLVPRQMTLAGRVAKTVVPLAIGCIVGSLPILVYLMLDPQKFLAHVIGFHTGPHIAYWSAQSGIDEDAALSLGDKSKLAYAIWFSGANLLLIFALILFPLQALMREGPRRFAGLFLREPVFVALALLVVALVLSFVPTPSFPQYFALPIICAILLAALLFAGLEPQSRMQLEPAIAAIALLAVLANVPRLIESVPKLASPGKWTVMRVHSQGELLAKSLGNSGATGKVATLAPIYPLEAGLSVYPEFATGQFAYRVAEFAKPELRRQWVTTSPKDVETMLTLDPPAALLLGFEPRLEEPLLHFAELHGYRKAENVAIKDRYGDAVLYLREAPASSQ